MHVDLEVVLIHRFSPWSSLCISAAARYHQYVTDPVVKGVLIVCASKPCADSLLILSRVFWLCSGSIRTRAAKAFFCNSS